MSCLLSAGAPPLITEPAGPWSAAPPLTDPMALPPPIELAEALWSSTPSAFRTRATAPCPAERYQGHRVTGSTPAAARVQRRRARPGACRAHAPPGRWPARARSHLAPRERVGECRARRDGASGRAGRRRLRLGRELRVAQLAPKGIEPGWIDDPPPGDFACGRVRPEHAPTGHAERAARAVPERPAHLRST